MCVCVSASTCYRIHRTGLVIVFLVFDSRDAHTSTRSTYTRTHSCSVCHHVCGAHSPAVRPLGRHEGQADADDAPEHGEDDHWHDTHGGWLAVELRAKRDAHKVDRRNENSEHTGRRHWRSTRASSNRFVCVCLRQMSHHMTTRGSGVLWRRRVMQTIWPAAVGQSADVDCVAI